MLAKINIRIFEGKSKSNKLKESKKKDKLTDYIKSMDVK